MKVCIWDDSHNSYDKDIKIRLDDNLSLFSKKISVYFSENLDDVNHIYFWVERSITPSSYFIVNFMDNVFKGKSRIDLAYFESCVKNYFDVSLKINGFFTVLDRNDVWNILLENKSKLSRVVEPLLFKYTDRGFYDMSVCYKPFDIDLTQDDILQNYKLQSNESMTLEGLYITDKDVINVTSYSSIKINYLFPFRENKLTSSFKEYVKQIDELEDAIESINVEDFSHKSNINVLQVRCNEFLNNVNNIVNLDLIFDNFILSPEVPHAKYKTRFNAYFKYYKPILSTIDVDLVLDWSYLSMGSNSKNSFITYEIRFDDASFCSLTIFDTLVLELRFKFGAKKNISIDKVNVKIKWINDIFVSKIRALYPNVIFESFEVENLVISNVLTNNTMQPPRVLKNIDIRKTINEKFPTIFKIIEGTADKDILTLLYKKIDNFNKFSNIQTFVLQNRGKEKSEIVEMMMNEFTMTKETALDEYEKWSNDNLFLKARNFDHVKIKIKLESTYSSGIKFTTKGFTSFKIHDRICKMLKAVFLSAKKTGKVKSKNVSPVIVLDIDDEDAIDIKNDEDDLDFLSNLDDINKDFENISPKEQLIDRIKKIGNIKNISMRNILKNLYEADLPLFDYTPKFGKRSDYPSSCQKTPRRQPVVMTKDEYKNNEHALDGYVRSGVKEKDFDNYYVCPKIWCPLSRKALTYKEYIENDKKCPDEDEDPYLLSSSFWTEGTAELKNNYTNVALERPHYPGFLKIEQHHPENRCVPCCYTTNRFEYKDTCPQSFDDTLKKDGDSVKKKYGSDKYIKAENYIPVESDRYGFVYENLTSFMGFKKCNTSGLISNNTDCLLRKGIDQKEEPFLSCILSILDNKSLTLPKEILKVIHTNITLEHFIMLESGKLLKKFMDITISQERILIKKNFDDFIKWFTSQKVYIAHFNLDVLVIALENMKEGYASSSIHALEIMREFMVYESFKRFKKYIMEEGTLKDHQLLMEYISTEFTKININLYNFVMIEMIEDKFYIECPFNRDTKGLVNLKNPFIFIVKSKNKYYEPLCYISNKVTNYKFDYSTKNIKDVVDFYQSNCSRNVHNNHNIIVKLLTDMKYFIKYYVIDYDFKVKGVMIDEGLFVPFVHDIDMIDINGSDKLLYMNKIIKYKCTLKRDEVISIFDELHKETKEDTYNIINITEKDGTVVGIHSKTGLYIPIHDNDNTNNQDLEIFIGHQRPDDRTTFMKDKKQYEDRLRDFYNLIYDEIQSDLDTKVEMSFLIDVQNPIPKTFKRYKMMEVIKKHIDFDKEDRIYVERVCEMLLNGQDLTIYDTQKIYRVPENEIILEYADIERGKLIDIIQYIKNPFVVLREKLNYDEIDEFVVVDDVPVPVIATQLPDVVQDSLNISIFNDMEKKNEIPTTWKHLLAGFKLYVHKEDSYDGMFIYKIFSEEPMRLKERVEENLMRSFKIYQAMLLNNPCFYKELEKRGKKENDIDKDIVLSIIRMPSYFPSKTELQIISKLTNISIFIIERKTKFNKESEDKMKQIGLTYILPKGHRGQYVILNEKFKNKKCIDEYEIFTLRDGNLVLKYTDFNNKFWDLVNGQINTVENQNSDSTEHKKNRKICL